MGKTWENIGVESGESQKQIWRDQRSKKKRTWKYIFASLMDLCHLKNTELEKNPQKDKGRLVLWGDIVRDDSGSYAVFTEQGSSTSQMTAAKCKSFRD